MFLSKFDLLIQDQCHHVGSEVYQQYIASSSSPVKVDKAVLKGMEEFLRGDKVGCGSELTNCGIRTQFSTYVTLAAEVSIYGTKKDNKSVCLICDSF